MNCIGDMFYVIDVGSAVQVKRGRRWSTRGRDRRRGRKLKGGKEQGNRSRGGSGVHQWERELRGPASGGVAVQEQGRCWCSTEGSTCGWREEEGV